MISLQFLEDLQLTEHFSAGISEVRKYSKVAIIVFICFTALVVFKVKYSKQILFQSFAKATLYKFGHNITAERVTGIAQNTTVLAETAENVSVGSFGRIAQNITTASTVVGERTNVSKAAANASKSFVNHVQKLFEELASAFDKESCLSRYESSSYRKNQPYKPSPYLISKLRVYQDLHSRCGPHTTSYRRVIKKLSKSSSNYHDNTECKYVVWTPVNGIGNRMVSITSAFLYALLKSRVLLVEFEAEMDDLFCEPFPNSTWLLPNNFPHKHHWTNLPSLQNRVASPIVHLHLQHGKNDSVIEHFHCNDTQSLLETVPVVIILSDQYFAPTLFLMPLFKEELNRMFPEKGAVFHLLGHYLFNPSNNAWGLITRFYQAYLSKADEKIGLQIRVFPVKKVPYEIITTQILDCTLNHHILPSVGTNKSVSRNSTSKLKAILVSSLYPQFSENLRNMYWIRPTLSGDVIGVYQPSHEEYQKFGDNMHNMKAWAEIYLLSLCDVMVTSGQSTFGYVAQGLGALKPWILNRLGGTDVRNPSCKRGISSEPCFHIGLKNGCNGKKIGRNISDSNPHLKACEDLWWGVKLVNA